MLTNQKRFIIIGVILIFLLILYNKEVKQKCISYIEKLEVKYYDLFPGSCDYKKWLEDPFKNIYKDLRVPCDIDKCPSTKNV
jgi:hypothetical protein